MGKLLPGIALIASTALVAAISAGPRPDANTIAAVYPPWWSDVRIGTAAASAGAIAAGGGARNVILISGGPGELSRRAWRSGALFLLNTDAARLCRAPAPSGDVHVL